METVERERSQLAAIKIFTDFIKTYTHFENTAKASPSALEEAHASEGLMEIKVTPKYSLDLGEVGRNMWIQQNTTLSNFRGSHLQSGY